jgi:hypothetical protein
VRKRPIFKCPRSRTWPFKKVSFVAIINKRKPSFKKAYVYDGREILGISVFCSNSFRERNLRSLSRNDKCRLHFLIIEVP